MAPIVAAWDYFPRNKGAVCGFILLGFGFGSFIFGFVSSMIVNPDNEQARLKVQGGVIFEEQSEV